jgi:hypothetical protein
MIIFGSLLTTSEIWASEAVANIGSSLKSKCQCQENFHPLIHMVDFTNILHATFIGVDHKSAKSCQSFLLF